MVENVLVTGGSRNIGRAICERLNADGYAVVSVDIVEPEVPGLAEHVPVDLGDEAATAAALNRILQQRPISRLVNNAGIVRMASLEELDLADFDETMRVNTRAAIQCAQALTAGMRARGFGRIVSISSLAITGLPGLSTYTASKAALAGLTRSWAAELAGSGITVNAIAPGPIDTDMHRAACPPGSEIDLQVRSLIPVARLGQPEDVANAVSFFLDERSGYVTGQLLHVDGGMTFNRMTTL